MPALFSYGGIFYLPSTAGPRSMRFPCLRGIRVSSSFGLPAIFASYPKVMNRPDPAVQ